MVFSLRVQQSLANDTREHLATRPEVNNGVRPANAVNTELIDGDFFLLPSEPGHYPYPGCRGKWVSTTAGRVGKWLSSIA